jgi:hypothetical protein
MEKFNIGFDIDNNNIFEEEVNENDSFSSAILAGGSLENTQGVTATGTCTTTTNFTHSTVSNGDLGEGILCDRQLDSSSITELNGAAHRDRK